MPTVNTKLVTESNFLNLKSMDVNDINKHVFELLVPSEQAVMAFKTVRDQVIFTTKRIIVVNVQGITGKKTSYISYPYAKIQYFGIETAGVLDIDSELILAFSDQAQLSFDFKSNIDIRKLNSVIGQYIL